MAARSSRLGGLALLLRLCPQPIPSLLLLLQLLLLLSASAHSDGSLSGDAARLLEEIQGVMRDVGSLDGLLGSANCDFHCANGGDSQQNATYQPRFAGCTIDDKEVDLSGIPGMAECCENHSRCYGTCQSNKATCDSGLETCWKLACNSLKAASTEAHQACISTASVYAASQLLMGCRPFTATQAEACVCPQTSGRREASGKLDEL